MKYVLILITLIFIHGDTQADNPSWGPNCEGAPGKDKFLCWQCKHQADARQRKDLGLPSSAVNDPILNWRDEERAKWEKESDKSRKEEGN